LHQVTRRKRHGRIVVDHDLAGTAVNLNQDPRHVAMGRQFLTLGKGDDERLAAVAVAGELGNHWSTAGRGRRRFGVGEHLSSGRQWGTQSSPMDSDPTVTLVTSGR